MKTFALAAFCAILSQCHAREPALSRPKRTLRMLESLFGSMRDTFAPLTAPALTAAQSPSEVILAAKYPVGVKYAFYPTVRMHIRPIQQHVIYMQSMPAIPGPALRPVGPLNAGAVDFLRPMAPQMGRLPKTQTTTTIHYEIIPVPVPVPVHSEPQLPAFSSPPSPPPLPPPPPSTSSPFSYDETDDPSAPWSLDELPPPVPTSAPLNPLDEPNVPWNLHALPPPVATKQPRGNEAYGWPLRSGHHHSMDDGYTLPAVFDKKLVIPAPGIGPQNRHRTIFRPSPLQSEISVQPSVEVAAYSQTQTLAQQPAEYVNRLRNLNSPRPQVLPNRNNRLRREAPPAYFADAAAGRRVVRTSPHREPAAEGRVPSPAFASRESDGRGGHETPSGPSARPPRPAPPPKAARPRPPDFVVAVRSESADARPQRASGRRSAPSIGPDIRLSGPPGETSPAERYVLITPRPAHHSRRSHADAASVETRPASGHTHTSGPEPQGSALRPSSVLGERGEQSALSDRTKGRLRFPPTGSLFEAPRRPPHRPSFFASSSKKAPPLSVDSSFDDRPTQSPFSAGKSAVDQLWRRSDYDNVEYFEPIIIDIGGGDDDDEDDDDAAKRRRSGWAAAPKVEFKLTSSELKKSTRREPLRLPGRLRETVVDRLSEALVHPPIFDVESEATEPRAVVVLVGDDVA